MPILKILLLSKEIRMCTGRQNQRRRKIYTEFTEKIYKEKYKTSKQQSPHMSCSQTKKEKNKRTTFKVFSIFEH